MDLTEQKVGNLIRELPTDQNKKNIVTTDTRNRNFFTALKDCLCVPNWTPEMFEERETTFCIAQIQFNNADRVHTQILQTIYMKLTGAKMECPRFGSHWEVIGFQGKMFNNSEVLNILPQEMIQPPT